MQVENPSKWYAQVVVAEMSVAAEQIDGGKATLAELRRVGVEALVRALGPVGMARFLQQFDPGQGDYTAERGRVLGPTVDQVMDELERNRKMSVGKQRLIWHALINDLPGMVDALQRWIDATGNPAPVADP